MEITLENFLKLKFRYENHDNYQEGNKCIYQDLIKSRKNIREILFCIANDFEYLNTEKYDASTEMKYDHMKHYINCLLFGFRKDIIEWRNKEYIHKLADKQHYLAKEKMNDTEIELFLSKNKISVDKNYFVIDGFHRCFCMMGILLRGEKFLPLIAEKSLLFAINNLFVSGKKRSKINNIGYRPRDNKRRLRKIFSNLDSSNFTLLDVGSNYGFFSLCISEKYPNSQVFSVEGSFGTGNEDVVNKNENSIKNTIGIQAHNKLKNKNRLFNNHIFCMLMTIDKIEALLKHSIRFDYQLSLSVFHWIVYEKFGNSGEEKEIYKSLQDHLLLANTTFIELPDIKQETSLMPIYKNHSSVYQLLLHIKNAYLPNMDIVPLTKNNWYGTRYLYKVSLDSTKNDKCTKDDLLEIFKPQHVY